MLARPQSFEEPKLFYDSIKKLNFKMIHKQMPGTAPFWQCCPKKKIITIIIVAAATSQCGPEASSSRWHANLLYNVTLRHAALHLRHRVSDMHVLTFVPLHFRCFFALMQQTCAGRGLQTFCKLLHLNHDQFVSASSTGLHTRIFSVWSAGKLCDWSVFKENITKVARGLSSVHDPVRMNKQHEDDHDCVVNKQVRKIVTASGWASSTRALVHDRVMVNKQHGVDY